MAPQQDQCFVGSMWALVKNELMEERKGYCFDCESEALVFEPIGDLALHAPAQPPKCFTCWAKAVDAKGKLEGSD
jgi:hypothetical protein